MWNNTRILNLLANLMFVVAALIIARLATIAVLSSPWFPLRKAVVTGDVEHVVREQVTRAFAGRALGNFFGADLEAVRAIAEELPWVRTASVRRQWPDALVITLEEHRALARWSDRELVNTRGELFVAQTTAWLPRLHGPQSTEGEVTERFYRFREVLKPIGAELVSLNLSHRYAWTLGLADGLTIQLGRDYGRDDLEARLIRFVRVYPETVGRVSRRLNHVDLRYPNGFALRVPEIERLELEREREEKRRKQGGPARVGLVDVQGDGVPARTRTI